MLMNGILVHGLDFDDTHANGVIHATASCFPCALGVAAHTGARRPRAARGVRDRRRSGDAHRCGREGRLPPGRLPSDGARRRLRLHADRRTRCSASTREQLAMAQGIALSVGAGSLEFLQDGAWTKRMHPGWAAVAGYTAASLARHGFVGPRAAYEGRFGLFASHLGERLQGMRFRARHGGPRARNWELGQRRREAHPRVPLHARLCRRRSHPAARSTASRRPTSATCARSCRRKS